MTSAYQSIYRLLSVFAILWACSTHALANDMRITVTLPPLAGLVHLLSPDANVSCLLPGKADPHHFELSPRQIETLQNSDMLIRASSDDAHWHGLIHNHILDLWPQKQHPDNHSWLSPDYAEHMIDTLATSMPGISAATTNDVKANMATMQQHWRKTLSLLKARGVIMQHPAWETLFEAYDVPVLNVLESNHHGQEQGPRALENALIILKSHPNAVLIGDTNHSNRTLQWVARHAGDAPIIYLDALGTCSENWLELMQRNLDALNSALNSTDQAAS